MLTKNSEAVTDSSNTKDTNDSQNQIDSSSKAQEVFVNNDIENEDETRANIYKLIERQQNIC